jgi:hypothetical protein
LLAFGLAHAASVSPEGTVVPANLLRLQIHLDAALQAPLELRRVHLFDGRGREIERAFLDLPLPSRDGRTVTLLLHPGRLKTDVGPNLQFGAVLRSGQTVTLVVDGLALRKTWRVTPAVRQPLALASWRFNLPRSGSTAALVLQADVPLGDAARVLIAVADASGRRVAGRAELGADDSQWRFVPAQPWHAGPYTLRVHPALEDVAGNRLCAAFEQRELRRADCTAEGRREFVVGAD